MDLSDLSNKSDDESMEDFQSLKRSAKRIGESRKKLKLRQQPKTEIRPVQFNFTNTDYSEVYCLYHDQDDEAQN